MKQEDRKQLLDIAQRRVKPGSGSALQLVRETSETYQSAADFPDMGEIPYVIVGGLATALYMPPRMTLDTDLLIMSEDLERAESLFEDAGCQRTGTLTIGGSTWRLPAGRSVDLIALDREWVVNALDSAIDDHGRRYVSLPFLVLMKLESGRLQDLADISRMLGHATEDETDAVRAAITEYRPQDTDDLESMIRLGKLEHE